MITIFTPTYNRAYIITQLYKSLCAQSNQNFEWLIVDDGSTDQTESVIQAFINDNEIKIRYYKQENGGKHRAINRGVELAEGELFFIVDSDDYLHADAVKFYSKAYEGVRENDEIAGVSGRRMNANGTYIGSRMNFQMKDCTALDLRMKYNIEGDMAEAYKTSVLKKYPFPDIAGEKFCPESLVWNRISQKYFLRFYNEGYYYCEYLGDGLTSKIAALRMKSPETSMLYYSELEKFNIPYIEKLKANINYWRFGFNSNGSFLDKQKKVDLGRTLIGMAIGFSMYMKDKKQL